MKGYETRDLRFSAIAITFAALGAALALVALSSSAVLRAFSRRAAAAVRRPPPPEPRIEADLAEDMRRHRAEEEAELNGYAWIDARRGVIRLPIGRAMELLLRRGLPERAAAGRNPP